MTDAATLADPRGQTLASFDWQWSHLPAGDFMPGDPWFDAHAARVLAEELCALAPAWFSGRRVLDAGCGQGRWTRVLLALGAEVTAVDFSEAGLARTRALAGPGARLTTMRADLLRPPAELAARRFDLVFSFGVLHHTGDTWRALANVAELVGDAGALFLYLYGAESWPPEQRREIERVRQALAPLAFDEKLAELRRRYPGDDPHQMFDLLSPVINDRVRFDEVADRLRALGFARVDRTIAHTEVYVRAVRAGFPESALLPPEGEQSTYLREVSERFAVRKGAAWEDVLRAAVAAVAPRPLPPPVAHAVAAAPPQARILDASFAPDRVQSAGVGGRRVECWDGPSPAHPEARPRERADVVVFAGAALGACRFPDVLLERLWAHVASGGELVVELAEAGLPRARRTPIDRARDYRRDVPGKLAALLARRAMWCSGEGLFALGGPAMLGPIGRDRAAAVLTGAGATSVRCVPCRAGTSLLRATRAR